MLCSAAELGGMGACRPLVLGERKTAKGSEWCVASEDCAFGPIGFQRVRDVRPGEMIIINETGGIRPPVAVARLSWKGALTGLSELLLCLEWGPASLRESRQ